MKASEPQSRAISLWEMPPGDRASLLAQGVPVGRGRLLPDGRLRLHAAGGSEDVPMHWEPRASWPDGSVRWIFLHADLPRTGKYALFADPAGIPAGLSDAGGFATVRAHAGGFEALWNGEVLVRCTEEIPSAAGEGPGAGSGDGQPDFEVVRLEGSPLSGLYRVRGPLRGGFRSGFTVRTDSARRALEVVWRISRETAEAGFLSGRVLRFQVSALDRRSCGLSVVDGARRGPCRQVDTDDGFEVRLFEGAEPFPVAGGTSFRQRMRLWTDRDLPSSECRFLPGWLAATEVLGPVGLLPADSAGSVAPGVVAGVRAMMEQAWTLAESADPAYGGVENFGDWPLSTGQYSAGKRRAYADNEYDMPFTCLQTFAATGEARWFTLARRCAEHMADVDVRCTDGVMLYHGYGDEAEDHRTCRVPDGDMGHVWSDGLWLVHLWTGDPFLAEAAEKVTRWVVGHFQKTSLADEFAICERNVGWPLLVAAAALENGGPAVRAVARPFAESILRFLDAYTKDPDAAYEDPEMPVWWRCALHDGSKPFMMGTLSEGLERMHRLDGGDVPLRILDRLVDFIVERTFDPLRVDFQYEFNAFGPGHREIPAQQLIPLFVRGLLYSAAHRGSEALLWTAAAAFQASTWCLFDPEIRGKEIALMGRGAIPSLALLEEARARSRRTRARSHTPSGGDAVPLFEATSPTDVEIGGKGYHTDAAWVEAIYRAASDDAPSHLNRQAFFHASDRPFEHSSLTLLCFYDRIQTRFHDADGRLAGSLDAFVPVSFFQRSSGAHVLRVDYRAPGTAVLSIDGKVVDRTDLDRPLSGAFHRIRVGSRPGNWKVDGSVKVRAGFGPAMEPAREPENGDAR